MTMIEQLDIQELALTETGFSAVMKMSTFHAQPQGFLNGGATLAFAEIAAGMASNLLTGEKHFAVGQSVNGNHLNTTKASGSLFAHGLLLHHGRRSHVWEIKFSDEQKILISQVTVTNVILEKKAT